MPKRGEQGHGGIEIDSFFVKTRDVARRSRDSRALDFWKGKAFLESRDRLTDGGTELVQVVDTPKIGRGLEAKKEIKTHERIFGIHGTELDISIDAEQRYVSFFDDQGTERISTSYYPTGNTDKLIPNAVCVGVGEDHTGKRDTKIHRYINPDPDNPLRYINHSCDPNAERLGSYAVMAKKDIHTGEPITIDYATLEINPDWSMTCHCDSPNCRGEIRSIQFLTPGQIQTIWDTLPGFIQHIYLADTIERYTSGQDKSILDKLKKTRRLSDQLL